MISIYLNLILYFKTKSFITPLKFSILLDKNNHLSLQDNSNDKKVYIKSLANKTY